MSELRNIWIFNHYANDTFFDKGGRHFWLAKYLKESGYEPVIFCSNKLHNTEKFCFDNDRLVNEAIEEETQVPYVFLKGRDYKGNGKSRALNMLDYYFNLKRIAPGYAKKHGKPDIIYASSVHPLALVAGIQLAKKFDVKCVCEVRDLWPESIVAMGLAKRNNPIIIALYKLEKWIYKKCDGLVMTLPGGYDYIKDMKYTGIVPFSKYKYINNGIDLASFYKNVELYSFDDDDLNDESTFKVIYTGSLRQANGIEQLLGCAKELLRYENIKFLVYGKGNLENEFLNRVSDEKLTNVTFKGSVEKKYIPYILSKGNLNILNYNVDATTSALYKYGSSQNKLFEYLASGKPIISNARIGYDIVMNYNCGLSDNMEDDKSYADALFSVYQLPKDEYDEMCKNARAAAEDFDFKNLTKELISFFLDIMSK
jgi:glycosyltransferase involved in cell wall biosynthesis